MTQTTDYKNEFVFDKRADYKSAFKRYVDELFARAKRGDLADRAERMALIDELIESYIAATGERPDFIQLDRLSTLILREELADTHPDKMSRNEYPIMSEEQYLRRTEGRHVRRTDKNGKLLPNKTEIPFEAAYDYGTDGADYRLPKRRRYSTDEALILDRKLSIDEDLALKYKQFIKPGKVEVKKNGN